MIGGGPGRIGFGGVSMSSEVVQTRINDEEVLEFIESQDETRAEFLRRLIEEAAEADVEPSDKELEKAHRILWEQADRWGTGRIMEKHRAHALLANRLNVEGGKSSVRRALIRPLIDDGRVELLQGWIKVRYGIMNPGEVA